jgi:hypothetical protein
LVNEFSKNSDLTKQFLDSTINDTLKADHGYFCDPNEESNDEYIKLKKHKGTACQWTDCFDDMTSYGFSQVQWDADSNMCSAIASSGAEVSKPTIKCNGPGIPIQSCKSKDQVIPWVSNQVVDDGTNKSWKFKTCKPKQNLPQELGGNCPWGDVVNSTTDITWNADRNYGCSTDGIIKVPINGGCSNRSCKQLLDYPPNTDVGWCIPKVGTPTCVNNKDLCHNEGDVFKQGTKNMRLGYLCPGECGIDKFLQAENNQLYCSKPNLSYGTWKCTNGMRVIVENRLPFQIYFSLGANDTSNAYCRADDGGLRFGDQQAIPPYNKSNFTIIERQTDRTVINTMPVKVYKTHETDDQHLLFSGHFSGYKNNDIGFNNWNHAKHRFYIEEIPLYDNTSDKGNERYNGGVKSWMKNYRIVIGESWMFEDSKMVQDMNSKK